MWGRNRDYSLVDEAFRYDPITEFNKHKHVTDKNYECISKYKCASSEILRNSIE